MFILWGPWLVSSKWLLIELFFVCTENIVLIYCTDVTTITCDSSHTHSQAQTFPNPCPDPNLLCYILVAYSAKHMFPLIVRLSLTNIPKHLHNPHIYFRSFPFRISTSHSHYYFCFNHTHLSRYSSDLSVLLHFFFNVYELWVINSSSSRTLTTSVAVYRLGLVPDRQFDCETISAIYKRFLMSTRYSRLGMNVS